jgi:tRNA pseudouridine55 synthase
MWRKMAIQIDGLLIVDKPEGITSLEAVREVKRRFHVKKAGHIGTLDPFATGVLPIAINEGTKLVHFLEEEPKEYEGVMKLGEETSTDDLTGEITSRKPWEDIPPGLIYSVFHTFLGKVQQIPPMFSAVKIQGKPLYRLARKGIEIERKERSVEIFDIQVEEIDLPLVRFRVSCSKGTYIRTLGRDIGRKMGYGAHLISLRRLRSGPFTIKQAISWKTLKHLSKFEELSPWLISLKEALPSFPEVIGDEQLVKKVRIGKEMMVRDLSPLALSAMEKSERLKLVSPEEGLVAILKSEIKGVDIQRADPEIVAFRPLRIFHPSPHSSPQRRRGEGEGKDRINLKEEFHGTGSGEEKRDHRSV